MVEIHMFSSANKVKGQGVSSAYNELMGLMEHQLQDEFQVKVNNYSKSDISHYHTIDFRFFLSTFFHNRGRLVGYVHFLPETLEGSISLPKPIKKIFYKYVIDFYKRMDHIVVVNPSFIPKLEAYHIPEEKISYIPNFVSKKDFFELSRDEKLQMRQVLDVDEEKFVVFGAGQIQERKGIDDFVKLAKNNPDMQFIWAGGFSFGPMTDGYDRYKEIVNNPPVNLRFTGIIDRESLVDYYNIADVFLLPSFNELFPMSVLEAFSCGTPVLLRDLELYYSVIGGYYEKAPDEPGMDSILKDLAHNSKRLRELKEKSREASNYYSEEHLAGIWKKFYLEQANEESNESRK